MESDQADSIGGSGCSWTPFFEVGLPFSGRLGRLGRL